MSVWLVWWREEVDPMNTETPCQPWGLHSIHARQESAFACAAALHLHETTVVEEGVEP